MNLLPLALQAVDDPDALPVLGDAVIESGWDDEAQYPLEPYALIAPRLLGSPDQPTREWAWAIVAVLLFKDWQTTPWPAPRLSVPQEWIRSIEGSYHFESDDELRERIRGMAIPESRSGQLRIIAGHYGGTEP